MLSRGHNARCSLTIGTTKTHLLCPRLRFAGVVGAGQSWGIAGGAYVGRGGAVRQRKEGFAG